MPQQWMTEQETEDFLRANHIGRLATVNQDGSPYITPLNYAVDGQRLYFHGKAAGAKMANIAADPRVCFEVSRVDRQVWQGEKPCGCATRFTSVLAFGNAHIVDDAASKARILNLIMESMAAGRNFCRVDERMATRCCIVAMEIARLSGKRNGDPPAEKQR